jgi:DNA-binding FadR family transcriptional regulator
VERERNTGVRQDELVAAHVRALIETGLREGELRPGDKLPFTQGELAAALGVNRNSVYWGLTTLRREGLIIGVQGGRAVIAPAGSGPEDDGDDARPGYDEAEEFPEEL